MSHEKLKGRISDDPTDFARLGFTIEHTVDLLLIFLKLCVVIHLMLSKADQVRDR